MSHTRFVADLAVVLGVAALTFIVSRRLRQPAVLGYLVAGLIVGPYLPVPLFANPQRIHALSEFGVVLVMFAIGLEFRIARLIRVLPTSGATGLMQMGTMLFIGLNMGSAFGFSPVQSLFLGAALSISSTMVVSAVFDERPVEPDVRELVLGVLVLQDVAAIVLMATLTVVASGGNPSMSALVHLLGRLAVVVTVLVAAGLFVVPRGVRLLYSLGSAEGLVIGATGLCFGMAVLAESLGYSVALGAFVAGILVAESGRGEDVEHAIAPLKTFFSAVFFVSVGMTVDPALAYENLPQALALSALVILGQLISVTIGGVLSGNGLRRSLGGGLALGQIGEFSFIIAAIGEAANIVPKALTPMLVTVATITAFTTPLAISISRPLANQLQRRLPPRLLALLLAYEGWFEQIRAAGDDQVSRSPRRRAVQAVIFDGLGLVAIAGLFRAFHGSLLSLVAERLGFAPEVAFAIVAGVASALALPLAWTLFKNTDHMARIAISLAQADTSNDRALGIGPAQAKALLLLAFRSLVVLLVGMPCAMLLRPWLTASYAVLAAVALLSLVALSAVRTVRRPHGDVRSATEALLSVVANQRAEERVSQPHGSVRPSSVFPASSNLRRYSLLAGTPAVGETLASLDLRARTGAAVLAIHRGPGPNAEVIVPTATDVLEVGDLLVLAGSGDALALAKALLLGVAQAPATGAPQAPAEGAPQAPAEGAPQDPAVVDGK